MRAFVVAMAIMCAIQTGAAPAVKFHVNPKVNPVAQTGRINGCWAASAAMVWGWKNNQSIGMDGIAAEAGPQFVQLLTTNATLLEADVEAFAKAIGLVGEVPQSYTVAGFRDLLAAHGPLWFGTKEKIGKHARVVTGIEGDGTVDGTMLYFIDPNGGQVTHATFRKAMENYEKIAAGTAKGVDLTIQIFHP